MILMNTRPHCFFTQLKRKRYKCAGLTRNKGRGKIMSTALRTRLLFAVLVLCLVAVVPAFAQIETATLSGVIQDPNGRVVPDVEVSATRIETGIVATTKTN